MSKNIIAQFSVELEREKLKRITNCIEPKQKELCESLIADAAFLADQLEKLRTNIKDNGWSQEYKNGKDQWGIKSSVEADYYLKCLKQYQAIIKQLSDLIPKRYDNDELLEFLRNN